MQVPDRNKRFAIDGRLRFVAGPGGLAHAVITAGDVEAELALQGGHVLSYRQAGGAPLLWVSRETLYAPGKAIRGGIPVCWPWFGPHPGDPTKPAHGFVRTQLWEVLETGLDGAATVVRLGLADSPSSRALWPHAFRLELTASVGAALDVTLTASNPGDAPFSCGGALHSYFTVGDVTAITIEGLENTPYLDQLTGAEHTQTGPVTIGAEVDRVYRATTATCTITDPTLGRQIVIAKSGSRSTVVWNPWAAKAQRLSDMADDEYPQFVCIETANALDDQIEVAPGASHSLRATIHAEVIR